MPQINVQYPDIGNAMLKAEQIKGAQAANVMRQTAIEGAPQKKKHDLLQYENDLVEWVDKSFQRIPSPVAFGAWKVKAAQMGVPQARLDSMGVPTTPEELAALKVKARSWTEAMQKRVKTTVYNEAGDSTDVLLGPGDTAPEGWSTVKKVETPLAKSTRLRKEGRETAADKRARETAARAGREEKRKTREAGTKTERTARLDKEKAVKRISDLENRYIMIKSKGVTPDMLSGVSAEAGAILQGFMGKKLGEADLASIRAVFDQEIAGLREVYGITGGRPEAAGGSTTLQKSALPPDGTAGTYKGRAVVVVNGAWEYAD